MQQLVHTRRRVPAARGSDSLLNLLQLLHLPGLNLRKVLTIWHTCIAATPFKWYMATCNWEAM